MEKENSKTFSTFNRVLLYLIASLILFLLFPREGKFRFEFIKGRPWMHETLIAPFDFPIYKSDERIKAEKDSLLKDFIPFFRLDTLIAVQQTHNLDSVFWARWINATGLKKGSEVDGEILLKQSDSILIRDVEEQTLKILTGIYKRGIIDRTDIQLEDQQYLSSIRIIENNIASEVTLTEIYTERTAYENLIKNTRNAFRFRGQNPQKVEDILRGMNLHQFIHPNLYPDKQKSKLEMESLSEDISYTEGMVLQGERIISKGERIDDARFQILQSLKKETEDRLGTLGRPSLLLAGQFILVFVCVLMIFLFLHSFRKEVYQNRLRTFFILFLIVLLAGLARLVTGYTSINVFLIPFAILPIIIKTFYDSRLALFIHIVTLLLIGFWVPNSFEFVFMNFVAGIAAIFSLSNLYRRGKFFLSSVMVILAYSLVYFGLFMLQEAQIKTIDTTHFIHFALNGLLVLSSFPLIYIFEKAFGFLSDATLMELTDTNHRLLRKLAELAPGTFQHSLQVANLAEEAIVKIGGSHLMVRAGSLYHDIGKIENPLYFIENQARGINQHDQLDYASSARVIIDHVKDGIALAKKYNLPPPIVEFISSHHGTTTASYFYKSYLKDNPEGQNSIELFRYPGPRPKTKEAAVIMMADAIEATSRSLADVSENNISKMVDEIINQQLAEEQFNEANITFREISIIREIFKKRLQNIFHVRIAYPK